MIRLLTFIFCVGFAFTHLASANGSKRPKISITFHLEANDLEGRRLSIPAKTSLGTKYIQKSPTLVTSDFVAYYPFVSPHENEKFGVSLQLKKTAAIKLATLSAEQKGKFIIANINGQVVDMIRIDKGVDGRVITIWRGVDPKFLEIVNPILPRIGEKPKEWKARLKAEKKASKKKS